VDNDYASNSAAQNNGRPLREQAPRSPVLTDMDGLARHLLGLPAARPVAPDRANVFGRMVRAFGLVS
jgi:hypothetical protein